MGGHVYVCLSWSWTDPENFFKICLLHQTLFNFFLWTNIQTDMPAHPYTDE
jgi:hypothetical protein